jgi:hypothetical protein
LAWFLIHEYYPSLQPSEANPLPYSYSLERNLLKLLPSQSSKSWSGLFLCIFRFFLFEFTYFPSNIQ